MKKLVLLVSILIFSTNAMAITYMCYLYTHDYEYVSSQGPLSEIALTPLLHEGRFNRFLLAGPKLRSCHFQYHITNSKGLAVFKFIKNGLAREYWPKCPPSAELEIEEEFFVGLNLYISLRESRYSKIFRFFVPKDWPIPRMVRFADGTYSCH